ncbi:MAG: 50S ribosome-binding GTPase, partial [Caldilineaceae bacterium]|nr:50S ribosome-binding GTPase [Caldilineaceae bacterium]
TAGIVDSLTKLSVSLKEHIAGSRDGEILSGGFRAVLAGPPNAGKSSLLNALAKRDAAIVSDEPGTTRDIIDVRLDLGGYLVIVSDTAGLRDEGAGKVEQIGMDRARARIQDADLVVYLDDGRAAAPPDIDPERLFVVRSKCDLTADLNPGAGLAVSVVSGQGLDALVAEITRRAARHDHSADDVLPTRARHQQPLTGAADEIGRALERMDDATLAAEHLRLASDNLGRLTGAIDVEDILGSIFSSFCIGK